ncbi:MAG: kynureninase, partial [Chloroflexota bacterium]
MAYRTDGFRFLNGTPSVPALYAVQPGLAIIAQVGVEAIRAKSVRQTTRLIELAQERGFR